jgi:uncharacterized protein (DUF2141 family)
MIPKANFLTIVLIVVSVHAMTARVQASETPVQVLSESPGCEQSPYSVLVLVKNVKDDRGTITIDLHGDDPETFLKSGAKLARLRIPSVPGEMHICVPVERPGLYAIALYQDRDSNLKLDKTWIGLPSEPFGVSRDAPIRMAPPKWKDAVFEVTGPLTPVAVTLRR